MSEATPVDRVLVPFVAYDPASMEIVRFGACVAEDLVLQGAHVLQGTGRPDTHYVTGGVLTAYTALQAATKAVPPNYPATWQNYTFAWSVPALGTAQAQQLALLKAARDEAVLGGMTWSGSRFDTDETSQSRILGLYVSSQARGFTSQAWRLADNTWRLLGAADVAGVWLALQTHLTSNFAKFAALEVQVKSATNVTAVQAITWPQ